MQLLILGVFLTILSACTFISTAEIYKPEGECRGTVSAEEED